MGEQGFPPEYQGLPIGKTARGRIGSTWGMKTPHFHPGHPQYPHPTGGGKVFRVRTGNGYYGTVAGQKYQDVMNYIPPSNPRTEVQQDWRKKFQEKLVEAQALTPEEKEIYIQIAKGVPRWSWFSAFMSTKLLV